MAKPLCMYINCGDLAAKEGKCGPHFNDDQLVANLRKAAIELTPGQIKKAEALQRDLDNQAAEDFIDLDWWFDQYGEAERPAKFMNREYWLMLNWDEDTQGPMYPWLKDIASLTKSEALLLNAKLKELDGSPVNGGAHIWTFVGRKHFLREGKQNQFACLPVSE